MGVPTDNASMVRAITIMPGFVVPSFGISYLEQWRIRCVVDFGELDKWWKFLFCLCIINNTRPCLLLFVVCVAFAFVRGGYHCNDIFLKSCQRTFEAAVTTSVDLVVFNDGLVHEVLQIGNSTTIVLVNLVLHPLCPCFRLFDTSVGIEGM